MERPKINIPMSPLEKVLQLIGAAALLFTFVQLIFFWGSLPATIATHFNGAGNPDGWGSKTSLLFMPILSLVMAAVLTLLERFPHIYNLPCEVTERNAPGVYQAAREMVVWLKLILILTFGYIEFMSIQTARGATSGLGEFFLPVSMGFLLAMMIIYIIRIVRKGRVK